MKSQGGISFPGQMPWVGLESAGPSRSPKAPPETSRCLTPSLLSVSEGKRS